MKKQVKFVFIAGGQIVDVPVFPGLSCPVVHPTVVKHQHIRGSLDKVSLRNALESGNIPIHPKGKVQSGRRVLQNALINQRYCMTL